MDEVEELCDKICILKNGECIFYGTVKDAVSKSLYEKFEDAYLWYTDEEVIVNEKCTLFSRIAYFDFCCCRCVFLI